MEWHKLDIRIDRAADAAYASLQDARAKRTEEVAAGIMIDYDAADQPVGVEILYLARRVGTDDPTSYVRGLVEGLLTQQRQAAEWSDALDSRPDFV